MTTNRFTPRYRYITAITNAQQAVITTDEDHDFIPGEIVSFRVSQPYGMRQLNNQSSLVLTTTTNTITVDLDTMFYDPYIYPVSGRNTPPVVVPSASGIIPNSNPATVTLADAFDNVRV